MPPRLLLLLLLLFLSQSWAESAAQGSSVVSGEDAVRGVGTTTAARDLSPSEVCEAYQPEDNPRRSLEPARAFDHSGSGAAVAVTPSCESAKLLSSKPVHVLDFAADSNSYLLVRNGESEGTHVSHDSADRCLRTLARLVVKGAGPKFLYTSGGLPLRNLKDAPNRVIYVLGGQETWVWPGVQVNYSFVIDNVNFTTVSLKPRAFLLRNFLPLDFADEVVKTYNVNLERSPEKHYSKGFENHRTSTTGWMNPTDAPSIYVRTKVQRVLRLPYIEYVEVPQFLRYDPGQWYRYHHGQWTETFYFLRYPH